MTWTYTPDFTTNRDQVRFLMGDVDSTDPLVTDEEIAFAVTQQGALWAAAAACLESVAARYARRPDSKTVGSLSISYGDLAKRLRDQAREIRTQNAAFVAPWSGGISKSEKETAEDDDDRLGTDIRRDVHSYARDMTAADAAELGRLER